MSIGGSWGGGGSGLGHGAGLLLVDVAAHAAGVDAWKSQKGQQREGQRGQRSRRRRQTTVSGLLRLAGSHSDSSVEDNWWADSTP